MTTKTAQFTPGPLETTYEPATKTWSICLPDGGDVLAQLVACEADATLFAAAPAMYEVLQHAAMSYHHPSCKARGEYAAQPERYCTCHVQKARYALAQAEGR